MAIFPIEKYRFYETGGKIIAVSSFAGKKVRGIAKCDPRDDFNQDKGKNLAATRCALKIARRRQILAQKRLAEAKARLEAALAQTKKMEQYAADAVQAVENTETSLAELLGAM